MVSGEAGLRKASSIRHLLRELPIRNLLLLEGSPHAGRGAFAPFGEALAAVSQRDTQIERAKDIALQTASSWFKLFDPTTVVAGQIPQIANFFRDTLPSFSAGLAEVGFTVQKRLATLARGKAVVLLLRNIESYDASSTALIDVLLRNRAIPVSYILTYDPLALTRRDTEMQDQLELLRTALRSKYGVREVEYRPFTAAETEMFIGSLLRWHTLNSKQLRAIHDITGGNPQFIQELLDHLHAEGELLVTNQTYTLRSDNSVRDLPRRMVEIIDARISRLQEDLRSIIDVAAVVGVEFQPEPITYALKIDQLTTLRRLRELERTHRLIVEEVHSQRFTYEAIHSRVYQNLGKSIAREQHLLIARFLAANPLPFDNDYHVHSHYLSAGRPAEALPHLVRSAEQSHARGSHREAWERYSAAARLTETGAPGSARTLDLWLRAARSLEDAGEFTRAAEIFHHLSQTAQDSRILACSQLHLGLCEYMSDDSRRAIAYLNVALERFTADLSATERIHARIVIASALYHLGEWDAARASFRKCFRDKSIRDDYVLRSWVRKNINMFYIPELALPLLMESWHSLGKDRAGLLFWEIQHNIACNHLLMGNLEEARELFQECQQAFNGFGNYRSAYPTNNIGITLMLSGNYNDAEARFREVLCAPMSDFDRVSAECHLALIQVLRGEVEEGAGALARLYTEPYVSEERILRETVGHNLGWARLLEGKGREAESLVTAAVPTRPHLWREFKIAATERLVRRIRAPERTSVQEEGQGLLEWSGRKDRWLFQRYDFWVSELWFWE